MRIEDGIKLDFQDVLIKPKRSRAPSRSSIQLERTFVSKYAGIEWTGVPIIAANMYGTGTMAMAAALSKHHMLTALHKHYSVEDLVNFFDTNRDLWDYTFYTIGINSEDVEKLKEVTYRLPLINRDEVFPKLLCVDAANFYTEFANDRIKEIREQFPRSFLMAGNVVSYEMTEQLILSGVDICKCGIGGGSACLTRVKAGVGMPQLSAAAECADAAHGLKGLVCSDGGCTCPGDVAKAIGAGSDFVMLGGMLAGTDECEGEWEYDMCDEPVALEFYGMSSKEAQEKHNGGLKDYRASEGKCVRVKYKGNVDGVVQDVLGGLRSACSYVGAEELKHLSKCCRFIRVNRTHNKIFG